MTRSTLGLRSGLGLGIATRFNTGRLAINLNVSIDIVTGRAGHRELVRDVEDRVLLLILGGLIREHRYLAERRQTLLERRVVQRNRLAIRAVAPWQGDEIRGFGQRDRRVLDRFPSAV